MTSPMRARRPSRPTIRLSLNDPLFRALVYQVLIVGAVALGLWYLISTTAHNLEVRRIASGFGFLSREAGLPIGESPIAYSPADTYAKALFVGLLNTLRVAVVGIVVATILGTLVGVVSLAPNWLLSRLARGYVEALRNLPLLLQLLFWWALFREALPEAREPVRFLFGEIYLSKDGLGYPVPLWQPEHAAVALALVVGIAAAVALQRWARRRQALTGQPFPSLSVGLAIVVLLPVAAFVALGAPMEFERPTMGRFRLSGGGRLTPEFAALLIGLVTYTAAFIAEIVRAGILAISHGQWEAGSALALRRGQILRLVILPQALRVIVPPMTSQYLNLTKNSSLAVAIGYPDIVSVANTILNQTGQAIEGIAIIMAVYLTISLGISAFMNWYNRRIALVER